MLKSSQNNHDCSQTNPEQQIHKLKYKKLLKSISTINNFNVFYQITTQSIQKVQHLEILCNKQPEAFNLNDISIRDSQSNQ